MSTLSRTETSRNRSATFAAVVLFAVLCATVAYWAMQLLAPRAPIAPAEVVADPRATPDFRQTGSLFGVQRQPEQLAASASVSNIQVLGLGASSLRPSAVLAVDGKPARPYGLGDTVTTGVKLVADKLDSVVIDRNGVVVELPAPARPSLSVLTAATGQSRRNEAGSEGGAALAPLPPHGAAAAPPASPAPAGAPPAGPQASGLAPQSAAGGIAAPTGTADPAMNFAPPAFNRRTP
jgi:general secretion pathway protein C